MWEPLSSPLAQAICRHTLSRLYRFPISDTPPWGQQRLSDGQDEAQRETGDSLKLDHERLFPTTVLVIFSHSFHTVPHNEETEVHSNKVARGRSH
jgi:hypothetical protein